MLFILQIFITYCTSNDIKWYTGGRDCAVSVETLLAGWTEDNPDGGENLRDSPMPNQSPVHRRPGPSGRSSGRIYALTTHFLPMAGCKWVVWCYNYPPPPLHLHRHVMG
jgi:hypothetical protein